VPGDRELPERRAQALRQLLDVHGAAVSRGVVRLGGFLRRGNRDCGTSNSRSREWGRRRRWHGRRADRGLRSLFGRGLHDGGCRRGRGLRDGRLARGNGCGGRRPGDRRRAHRGLRDDGS
jgi:hypothetical protein